MMYHEESWKADSTCCRPLLVLLSLSPPLSLPPSPSFLPSSVPAPRYVMPSPSLYSLVPLLFIRSIEGGLLKEVPPRHSLDVQQLLKQLTHCDVCVLASGGRHGGAGIRGNT